MLAYLHTIPDGAEEPRIATWTGGVPEIGPLSHLGSYLFEIGPVIDDHNCKRPISWVDLAAWQSATGEKLKSRDLKGIIEMSVAYLRQHQASFECDTLPPWGDPEKVDQERLIQRRKNRRANK